MTFPEINVHLFRMINDLGKEYTMLNPVMVFMAKYMVYVLIVAVIVYLFSRNKTNKIMVLCGVITFAISEMLGKMAGTLYSNFQPFAELSNVHQLIEKEVGNSFPSDLTILFFSVCMTFWLFKRGWAFLWVVLAILVGVSRIWVGVHYPADVVAGALISVIIATIIYTVVSKKTKVKRRGI